MMGLGAVLATAWLQVAVAVSLHLGGTQRPCASEKNSCNQWKPGRFDVRLWQRRKKALCMSTTVRSSPREAVALDRATLERFRQGDGEAFAQVVRTYSPLVQAAAARHFRSACDREEAMQEIWMHVFRHRQALDLEQAESFSGWLAVLVRRRCIDLYRQQPMSFQAVDLEEAEAWLSSTAKQEEPAEDGELLAAVQAFKYKLKPSWRQFFELYFVEGLDYEDISKRLSIGKLRCKYMRAVLARRAQRNPQIMTALGRQRSKGQGHAL